MKIYVCHKHGRMDIGRGWEIIVYDVLLGYQKFDNARTVLKRCDLCGKKKETQPTSPSPAL